MENQKLRDQTLKKLEYVMNNYYSQIFAEKVGEIESPLALQTREHFRTVPTEGLSPIEKGFRWGGLDMSMWVVGGFTVPESAAGKDLYAVAHTGGREVLFFKNGKPNGIFSWVNEAVSGEHAARLLCANAQPGTHYDMAFECFDRLLFSGSDRFNFYSNDTAYDGNRDTSHDDDPGRTYNGIDICAMNVPLKDLYYDTRELFSIVNDRHDHGKLRQMARRVLLQVANTLVLCPQHYDQSVWQASVEESLKITRPFFNANGGDPIFGRVGIIGHTHLDTAWLWPVKESIRKAARSFSNVLQLMDQYPDFKFMQSSALQTAWMKRYYPSVFEGIKKRIAEGRYELNGAVWVECDCNITSGESMIRSFLLGQRFNRDNFGKTSDTFWLPDTFGYHANIPQIMQGCGVPYFVTNKINCNEINPVEHSSFIWRGIDGSEVLAHIPVSGGHTDAKDVLYTSDEIADPDTSDKRLLAFGFGDGGGGPTFGMVEAAERVLHCPGMPKIDMMTVSDFMRELDRDDRDRLFVYDDEIYFEFHRGTLTQNHNVKRKNRLAEFGLRDMEYATVLRGCPENEKASDWLETLVVNQFHDILPGTCINSVYEVFNREMDEIINDMAADTRANLSALTGSDENALTVFNTLPFARKGTVTMSGEDESRFAVNYPTQHYVDVMGRKMTAVGGLDVPAFASLPITMATKQPSFPTVLSYNEQTGVVETPFATVILDDDGYIASFVDKASGRELRRPGGRPLGVFLIAEDCPEKWDNWNIDADTMDRLTPVKGLKSRRLVSVGPVELRIRSEYGIEGKTTLVQDMVFYADTPRVDFHTVVDWHSMHLLLKADFDLNLRAREAKCEIQYGHVNRPTHHSTPYDAAKFEVCNHKWTDISEAGFGVSLLNDCKYGVSFGDCNLALSLHRGGTYPDGTGDRGLHEMTYAILPHIGAFSAQNTVMPSYAFNVPAVVLPGRAEQSSFLTVDVPNVICEVVKPAEKDADGKIPGYVLRLYECEGSATETVMHLSRPGKAVLQTNMLEENGQPLPCNNGTVQLQFRPFEIKTILVEE